MEFLPWATVVVPTYRRPEMLARCLESIERALRPLPESGVEVIVSDDGHDDATRRTVASFAFARQVAGPRRGPAANRNCGARAARGRWLLFTDDDCVVDARWILAFRRAVESAGAASVLEGRTIADRPRRSYDEESPVNESGGYLWSCNMAVAAAVFWRLGGFCETFPHPALEDVDFRLRLEGAGERAIFCAEAVVCHPWRPRKGFDFIRHHNESYVHLLDRHPEIWKAFTWRSIAMDTARLSATALGAGWRYGHRGVALCLYAAWCKTVIDSRYKLRLRGPGAAA
jgi:glycosyltransferase involved in cell wall biosynthesis